MTDAVQEHGWTAVPRSLQELVASRNNPNPSTMMTVDEISIPDGELVQHVVKYAKDHLPSETFNHSMRVFYYG
jgi:cyanamide hydratase